MKTKTLLYSYIAIAAVLVCCLIYEGWVRAGIGGGVLCGVIGVVMFSLVAAGCNK